jgi:two-component system, NarL family, invasion response regulator UvrY
VSPRPRHTCSFDAALDVLNGRIALIPDIDHELALRRLDNETVVADVLTAREFEVLRLLLAEKTGEIADTPHLSVKTVANLPYLIRSKLGVGSDIKLGRLVLRQELLAQSECGSA